MSENNFENDLCFGKQYYPLLEVLFKHYFYESRYVFIDKSRFSTLVQKRLHVDMTAQVAIDESAGIELKVVRWPLKESPHTRFCLETRSCTNPGYESPGWMETSQADFLLYAFVIDGIGLDAYIINLPLLQQWFSACLQRDPEKWYIHTMTSGNRTESRLVPIEEVVTLIPTTRFLIHFDGALQKLENTVDIGAFRDTFLRQKLTSRIDRMLEKTPHDKGIEEPIEYEEEEESDWREVQQRVEEILAVRDMEDFLRWVDKIQQSTLWGDIL